VTSMTITTAGRRDVDRLVFIKRNVASLLTEVKHAAMEGYSYKSTGRVFELGEVGGVIKVLLAEHSIPCISVPPVSVKKFATGNAYADKRAMLSAATQRGSVFADDDQADAFFLAHIALAYVLNVAETRRELDVLASLRRPLKTKPVKRRARRLVSNAI
jgi:Holliday junction resolvasome RuvABC endonuclease subunit